MLQDIRANIQGTVAKIIIGLIVVSFSIFGIESLLFSGGGGAVAEVNGEDIDPYDLQQELSLQQRQLLAMLGDSADPSLLDEGRLRDQALEVLIQRTLLTQAAEDLGLAVSENALGLIIGGMEQFQIDGRFSADVYRSALANLGFTPAMFRQRLENDLLAGQLRAGLAGSAFSTERELALSARIFAEGRDVRYITLPLERYREGLQLAEEDIVDYYENNAERFMSEESLQLDYLELTLDDYREPVDEARLREEFELVRDQYEQSSETRVSHILVEGSRESRQARIAEAQAALAGGMEFSAAAEQFSDDIGSAGNGGDLGYSDGETFPEAMEQAISELPLGEVSAPVETDAGTHLLLVTDRRAGTAVTLEDVRGELTVSLQDRDASAALLRDVELLRDLAFNAADLEQPAGELNAAPPIQRSAAITRSQREGLFANPQLLQAAFSSEVLEQGHNSEVIELNEGQFVALRVAERQPPGQRPLSEVRADIASLLSDEGAAEAARQAADRLLGELESGSSVEDLANAEELEWQVELAARRDGSRLPAALRSRLFALPAPAQGRSLRVTASDTDNYYVLEFTRLTPGSVEALTTAERDSLDRRMTGETGGITQRLFEDQLRASADIKVY